METEFEVEPLTVSPEKQRAQTTYDRNDNYTIRSLLDHDSSQHSPVFSLTEGQNSALFSFNTELETVVEENVVTLQKQRHSIHHNLAALEELVQQIRNESAHSTNSSNNATVPSSILSPISATQSVLSRLSPSTVQALSSLCASLTSHSASVTPQVYSPSLQAVYERPLPIPPTQ